MDENEVKIASFVYKALECRNNERLGCRKNHTTAEYSKKYEKAYYNSCIKSNNSEDIVVAIHEKRMYPLKNARKHSTRMKNSEKFFEKYVDKDNKKKK